MYVITLHSKFIQQIGFFWLVLSPWSLSLLLLIVSFLTLTKNYPICINRSFLIEEKCRFLSNFSLQTAEVELPGEFLLPKVVHIYECMYKIHNIIFCYKI